jgi:oxazoline/thiazoline dehydrogenase
MTRMKLYLDDFQFTIGFIDGINLCQNSDENCVEICSSNQNILFSNLASDLSNALVATYELGANFSDLVTRVQNSNGLLGVIKLLNYLKHLNDLGWLYYSIFHKGSYIAKATRIEFNFKSFFKPTQSCEPIQCKYILSKFAYLRKVKDSLVFESSISCAEVFLDSQIISALTLFAEPFGVEELTYSSATGHCLLCLLLKAKILVPVDSNGIDQETNNPNLLQWTFHELLFHSSTRRASNLIVTETCQFEKEIQPSPVTKPSMSGIRISLYSPDLATLKQKDMSFTSVLESRRSIRSYGASPINKEQVGEFLYRVARIRKIESTNLGEISNRPYPSAGAIYELELYLAIDNCQGISRGLYHYEPEHHALCQLTVNQSNVEQLLNDASTATGETPQILIVITACFQRISLKYQSISYRLILQDLGVLEQTMYLVATAMKLAPCSIGKANSDLFTQTVCLDAYVETSVGEFALGSLKQT